MQKNMSTLCDKYKARCFLDIKGQDIAVEKLKFFIKNFPKDRKAIILHGPAGTGKTSLAYALAKELNSEILELNASDLRNREQLERIVRPATEQKSLTSESKIILLDEVDGISTSDRGGLPELLELIESTKFPIIMTANNIWLQKFNQLRQKSELVQVKDLDYRTISLILKDIVDKEKIQVSSEILASIAIKARGDVRAALNDLETVFTLNKPDDIHERDREDDIFNVLRQIFKNNVNKETLGLYDTVDMPLDEIYLWLEENIPSEYKGAELAKAYDKLSRADVFRGRIYRQQHWRFLVYQNILLSAGIASSKEKPKTGFTSYKKPGRILKIWLNNQKQAKKKSIAEKYSKLVHIGRKRAMQDFHIIKPILKKPEVQEQLKLSEDEIAYLHNQTSIV